MNKDRMAKINRQSKKLVRRRKSLLMVIMALIMVVVPACDVFLPTPMAVQLPSPNPESTPAPMPELPQTEVRFRVQTPANTPADTTVYLSILDEVTGLALNAERFPMQLENSAEDSSGGSIYSLNLMLPVRSAVKYRYERQASGSTVAEHISDGRAVRYRLYHVEGPGQIEDVVSRWTDTLFEGATGRIRGKTTDAVSGEPIPQMLIFAGGAQTLTNSDGSFLIEGLPPGVHNLVAYSLDGAYRVFQQGAKVAADSTTPAEINITPAPMVDVIFVVQAPPDTPPVVPLRLAGNLYQLGNTFSDLSGGVSTIAVNMPALSTLPDGRYTLMMKLPAGADIRYKYTLGDGFWNAEHESDGDFRVRQIVVPEQNTVVEDEISTWQSGKNAPVTFDVEVPAGLPTGDFVSIQFNPLFSWTEPIPMWNLGGERWAYVLYSPLNLPGDLNYRFCRNGQCGAADDTATIGPLNPGFPIVLGIQPQEVDYAIESWYGLGIANPTAADQTAEIIPRQEGFIAGIEIQPSFHPSWMALMPSSLEEIEGMSANWVIFSPTWTFTRKSPPVLEPVTGRDPLWHDLESMLTQSMATGLQTALFPQPNFFEPNADCWMEAERDFGWWLNWFENYRAFILHNADLAASQEAQALILGGEWLDPALPGGMLADGTPSGVPADAESRWRAILADVRSRYSGQILWASSPEEMENPVPFIDEMDAFYLLWDEAVFERAAQEDTFDAGTLLDAVIYPLHLLHAKPVILGASFDAAEGLEEQSEAYRALLQLTNEREWISGLIARGYYPPAALQDSTTSIHGKPAGDLVDRWFTGFLNGAPTQ